MTPPNLPPMPEGSRSHIVDVLIEERAPKLSGSWAWPLLRPPLYRLLDYRKGFGRVDQIAAAS